jgi:hypothetical protein
MREMYVRHDKRRTPSLTYSLLYTPCKRGRSHEAVARIALCRRFSYNKLREGNAAVGNLEEGRIRPLAGGRSYESGAGSIFTCTLCSNRNVGQEHNCATNLTHDYRTGR